MPEMTEREQVLRDLIADLREGCAEKDDQIEALRGFAQDIMEFWPHSELEGGDLQDFAEKHGLLKPEPRTEACGAYCACAEYGDFPVTCYRKTELLTGER